MPAIEILNDGPKLIGSNYWGSDLDRRKALFVSINAGCVRLLVITGWEECLLGMAGAREVILSRGPWRDGPHSGTDCLELLFEDGSTFPYAIHLTSNHCDRLPARGDVGRQFAFSAYTAPIDGMPVEAATFPMRYRIVKALPWLKPWGA